MSQPVMAHWRAVIGLGCCLRPARPSAVVTLLLAACAKAPALPGVDLLRASAQHAVVVVEQERDSTGKLYRYALDGAGWRLVGAPIPITVGAGGVAKAIEGDQRAPTGAYPLTMVFGYAESGPEGLRMPYLPLRPETECVDDPKSDQYNRIVNPSGMPAGKTWTSSEMMRRDIHNGDDLYKLGVVVGYNPDGRRDKASGKGVGSCIFLHVWRGATRPTVGCTAMPEDGMLDLLRWLDPAASPILVQGTRRDLEALQRAGRLPYPVPTD